MKNIIKKYILSCLLIILLMPYGSVAIAKTPKQKVITVIATKKPVIETLFFSGEIQPIKVDNVTSPAEGAILEKNFMYGQMVRKGQSLFKINSTKLETAYHSALTAYLKAKDSLKIAEAKFEGTKTLWELGIVSRNEYRHDKSTRDAAQITYLESLYNLEETIRTGQHLSEDIKTLDISDVAQVNEALKVKYNFINVTATATGIALLALKGSNEETAEVDIGDQVKLGQLLVVIGDLTGIAVDIHINEIDINKVKVGQRVKITGNAFPNITLQGYVASVNSQASAKSGAGGSPTFSAIVVVPNLSKQQREIIHVGMSAKVNLVIEHDAGILIPIKAVYKKNKQSMVKIVKGKQTEEMPVTTGQVSVDSVEIKSGLRAGDKIVVPD